ncbi:Pycsar system effector family protein [Halococcus sp. AFM35]|uniref:Pycsar system effector family protein n=1 Tax=Halococcus sp. AFM35 TaxID=3421653 RepID=UPI003EBAF598
MADINTDSLAERTHDHLNLYIRLADRKASILLTGQFAFLGLAATTAANISTPSNPLNSFVTQFGVMTAVAGIVAAVLCIVAIYPRTPSPGDSVIYWGDIRRRDDAETYTDDVTDLDGDKPRETVLEQNYVLAGVAETKYAYLRRSLWATVVMIGMAAVTGGVYLCF